MDERQQSVEVHAPRARKSRRDDGTLPASGVRVGGLLRGRGLGSQLLEEFAHHLVRTFRRADIADSGGEDIEPDDTASLEINERRKRDLLAARHADAHTDETPEEAG